MYAFWNNKKYRILNSINIKKSSREVTYSDLTLDFAKCNLTDLPFSQQEVKIYDNADKLNFCGFVASYKLPELKKVVTPQKELSLSLFTPRQLATKRTITITRTTTLNNAINQALAPLIQDGFVLSELNIPDKTVTDNLISRTVEETMNYFSNKYSLYWNIDEFKNIVVNSIEYQFSKPAIKNININNYKEEMKGFLSLTPSVQNLDYANIINVKNARIFYSNKKDYNVTLKNGDRLDFENPIDISIESARRINAGNYVRGNIVFATTLSIVTSGGTGSILTTLNGSGSDPDRQTITNVATDDSTGKVFILTMDSTFKNLATGFTYKGDDTITVESIESEAFLQYANMKLINWNEIKKQEGIVTVSGQIEKPVDVQNGWFTVDELVEYIRSLFTVNDRYTNQVNLKCDKNNGISIGDRLNINLPEYFVEGNFVVTDINENTEGTFPTQYSIDLRNTGLTENFIDLFRSSMDNVEQTSQIQKEYVVEYTEDEGISEIHNYDFKEFNGNHSLNFALNV